MFETVFFLGVMISYIFIFHPNWITNHCYHWLAKLVGKKLDDAPV